MKSLLLAGILSVGLLVYLLVALFSRRIPRRVGIVVSLALLSIPTSFRPTAPKLQSALPPSAR